VRTIKMTPLTRLMEAFNSELNLAKDEKLESELASKYLLRLNEAHQRRDATLKGLVIIDALLAVAVSGRNIAIPGTSINMLDIPALIEVLVGLASASVYIFTFSFATWLCYSQLYFVFNNRLAKKYELDPDLINFAETASEPTLKMFRTKLNIWGIDWNQPNGMFKVLMYAHAIANNFFFLVAPLLHVGLIIVAVRQIIQHSGFDFIHTVFFFWVLLAHVLAIFTWIIPSVPFSFGFGDSEGKPPKAAQEPKV